MLIVAPEANLETRVIASAYQHLLSPSAFNWMEISCESLKPSDAPKLQEGLKKIEVSQNCQVRVEESGEQVITGNGEFHMNHTLKEL